MRHCSNTHQVVVSRDDEHCARFTAHSSFDDPTSPPDAPAREASEVGTPVFFPPEK